MSHECEQKWVTGIWCVTNEIWLWHVSRMKRTEISHTKKIWNRHVTQRKYERDRSHERNMNETGHTNETWMRHVTWMKYEWDMSHEWNMNQTGQVTRRKYEWGISHEWKRNYSYVWRDSFIRVTWRFSYFLWMRHITRMKKESNMSHKMCWLIHIWYIVYRLFRT